MLLFPFNAICDYWYFTIRDVGLSRKTGRIYGIFSPNEAEISLLLHLLLLVADNALGQDIHGPF